MRKLMVFAALVVLAVLAWGGTASAATDSFTGSCTVEGTSNTPTPGAESGPLVDGRFNFVAEGTCNGVLNGEPLQDAPIRARGTATGAAVTLDDFALPLLFTGKGSATFIGEGANIGFTFQQVGPGLLAFEGNAGGVALGFADVLTPEQPEQPGKLNFQATAVALGLSG